MYGITTTFFSFRFSCVVAADAILCFLKSKRPTATNRLQGKPELPRCDTCILKLYLTLCKEDFLSAKFRHDKAIACLASFVWEELW